MKKILILLLALLLCMSTSQETMAAEGWPANYGGVMLQGFYWDSFTDTRWSTLEAQANELSSAFSLIWVPQSAKAASNPSMGYNPLYFYNQNSSFGNEAELKSMINTFKDKGLLTIADIVVNHRGNVSNWVDFPTETNPYDGKTYQMNSTDIVANDDGGATKNWAKDNGYQLSSNNDTGEDFPGLRDLDHKSENVRNNVKAYLIYLLNYLGYTGFRYDVAKGFSASYFGEYNQAAAPQFSVGEYWDGNASAVKTWINGTKVDNTIQSAAFDFPFRYTVRDAINNNDWTKLGGTSVMSDTNYRRYSVTFVENHDTERRANAAQDPITRDTLAANAFLLGMPGTPCVFLKHWQAYKPEIAAMIAARKAAGITNTSTYLNMASNKGYYANLVNSKLLVAVGNNVNAYTPNANYIEVLSGYHYRYFFNKNTETAWADKASGEYAFPFSVKLTAVSATSDAQLVYTLDGSTPTASSTKVASGTSISITNACTLTVGLLINGSVSGIITRQFFEKTSDPVVTPTYVEGKVFAYFEKPSNWNSSINVWAWQNGKGGEDYLGVGWPGVGITKLGVTENGNELWQWISTSTIVPDNIIFNDGSNQTSDLKFTNGGYYTSSGLQSVITGIETLRNIDNVEESNSAIYDLQGRRISQPTRPGIYIRNGKKYIK